MFSKVFCCSEDRRRGEEAASGLWRSASMLRLDLVFPRETAHDTIAQLGMAGNCQFMDCQEGATAFQRPFTGDIRRCDESERRLRYLSEQVRRAKIIIPEVFVPIENASSSRAAYEHASSAIPTVSLAALEVVEGILERGEKELLSSNAALRGVKEELRRAREAALVKYVISGPSAQIGYGVASPSTAGVGHSISGILDKDKFVTVQRLLFRVTRGNMVFQTVDITHELIQQSEGSSSAFARRSRTTGGQINGSSSSLASQSRTAAAVSDKTSLLNESSEGWLVDDDDEEDSKDAPDSSNSMGALLGPSAAPLTQSFVFVVYCSAPKMLERIRKVVLSLGARLPMVGGADSQDSAMEIESLRTTCAQAIRRRNELLQTYALTLESHKQFLQCEKAVLSTLNLVSFTGSLCRASVWIPANEEDLVLTALQAASRASRSDVTTIVERSVNQKNPPTFFRTNKYLAVFQGIVDSYGMARYKEVNPGVFTVITFPYLFGIMYGDIGHGLLLTLIGAAMVVTENRFEGKKLNEIAAMIFQGRYLILLMGLFATYIGILYNDFFGFSIELFSSAYVWPELPSKGGPGGVVVPLSPNGRPNVKPDQVYAFGIDSAWAETENKLEFYNSVKMKCAVIIGVLQMLLGIVLSFFNHWRERKLSKICFLFIPEFVFLLCTFGYMALLIVVKWCTPWSSTNDAPSLLETMTNFFLTPGTVTKELYPGQAGFQTFLLLVAVAMTPFMLFAMPQVEKRAHQQKLTQRPASSVVVATNEEEGRRRSAASLPDEDGHDDDDEDHPYDSTEVTIHYVIHTIEFVLGSVSNTASYLRLWALSLAHAQLSEVFFRFGILQVLSMDTTGVMTFVGAGVWFGATVGVLLGMEALSAFLHSLRLHWVEFQNKFYAGDGRAFQPLSLVDVVLEGRSK